MSDRVLLLWKYSTKERVDRLVANMKHVRVPATKYYVCGSAFVSNSVTVFVNIHILVYYCFSSEASNGDTYCRNVRSLIVATLGCFNTSNCFK